MACAWSALIKKLLAMASSKAVLEPPVVRAVTFNLILIYAHQLKASVVHALSKQNQPPVHYLILPTYSKILT